jgi:hypothetical protein
MKDTTSTVMTTKLHEHGPDAPAAHAADAPGVTPFATTTLAGAKALSDTFLSIATTTGMTRGMMFQIDNEYFLASSDAVGTQVPVLCGQRGSAQVAHSAGATVTWGTPSSFPNVSLTTYTAGVSLA